jgi:hypothetical protein
MLIASSAPHFRFSRLFPLYVGERQSRMRGLKVGWYSIDNEGVIAAGPYPTRDECVERIGRVWRVDCSGPVASARFDPARALGLKRYDKAIRSRSAAASAL